jgi:phage shock protein A
MVNRKKRLQKGIESLNIEIEAHKEKRKQALEDGNLELASYYDSEIKGLEKTKDNKEKILDKI